MGSTRVGAVLGNDGDDDDDVAHANARGNATSGVVVLVSRDEPPHAHAVQAVEFGAVCADQRCGNDAGVGG